MGHKVILHVFVAAAVTTLDNSGRTNLYLPLIGNQITMRMTLIEFWLYNKQNRTLNSLYHHRRRTRSKLLSLLGTKTHHNPALLTSTSSLTVVPQYV